MVEMEIPQHFLIDLKEFIIDYKIAEKRSDAEGNMKYVVFMVAAPLKVVESYMALIKSCGLEVVKVDFYGNSISKLIGAEYKNINVGGDKDGGEKGETIAVLDIGSARTNVSICRNNALKYSRSIAFGRQEFDSVIMKNGQFSQEELVSIYEEFDMQKCTRDYTGGITLLEQEFSNVTTDFTGEVSRILDFYTSREQGNIIDKIVITGGFSSVKNLDKYLTQELLIRSEVICPVRNFKISQRQEEFQGKRMLFVNCLGAAL